MGWIDYGTYWVNTAPQGSEEWFRLRNRPTASKFGAIAGRSKFDPDPDKLARILAGIEKASFTPEALERMNKGTINEPKARDWYCRTRNVQVNEVGLAVPKWDPKIGASLDGDVLLPDGRSSEGMIEIKCPERMYAPLDEYTEKVQQGWRPPQGHHKHIWPTHYDQMQGCMAITGKKWCDYIVFCLAENRVFVDRVWFNRQYWETELYPKIRTFNETLLKPLLKETGQEVVVPLGC